MAANEANPVERQVDPDAVLEDATGTVVMQGHDAMRATYSALFRASPDLRAKIATRIRVGE
jgi:hypothetical protein